MLLYILLDYMYCYINAAAGAGEADFNHFITGG